jgi:tellurite resistance protein TerC
MTLNVTIWGGFILFVLAMLAIDLGLFQRKRHVMSIKEALIWFAVWVGLAMLFNVGVFFFHPRGLDAGLEYFAGYVVEKSLSVDNIFVFVIIFTSFAVPRVSQHKVLMYGVLGAIVFRAIFIIGGYALLHRFHWMIYVFGLFLLVTGLRLLRKDEYEETHPENSWIIRTFRGFSPITGRYDRDRLFTRENGRLVATPLFIALLAIESADIVFSVDSIPAVFAITPDPFIVFSSNIFAILGLRSLYFAVSGVLRSFYFLRYGFATILVILAAKMLLADVIRVPIALSLVLIVFILLLCVIISLLRPRRVDLKGFFARTARLGLISFRRLLMIENVIDHGDLPLRDVMRKRDDVHVLRLDAPWHDNLKTLREARYTRYPILDDDSPKPVGILHVKDLVVRNGAAQADSENLRQLARPALELRDDISVMEAIGRLRRRANDLGLVFNQRGEWIGIITLEDLVEQLVGEIDDDFLPDQAQFSVADALTPGRVLLEFDASSIHDAIPIVINAIPEQELPLGRQTIIHALTRRSEQMTNYLGRGVMVPHARLDQLEKSTVIFARPVGGFEVGIDHEHADLLFIVLTPSGTPAMQTHLLSHISRLIGSDYVLEQLKAAVTVEEVIETIRTGEQVLPV